MERHQNWTGNLVTCIWRHQRQSIAQHQQRKQTSKKTCTLFYPLQERHRFNSEYMCVILYLLTYLLTYLLGESSDDDHGNHYFSSSATATGWLQAVVIPIRLSYLSHKKLPTHLLKQWPLSLSQWPGQLSPILLHEGGSHKEHLSFLWPTHFCLHCFLISWCVPMLMTLVWVLWTDCLQIRFSLLPAMIFLTF